MKRNLPFSISDSYEAQGKALRSKMNRNETIDEIRERAEEARENGNTISHKELWKEVLDEE